jgi:hypothetical protein
MEDFFTNPDEITDEDAALQSRIARALNVDQHLTQTIAYGIGVFPWRTIDAELAILDDLETTAMVAVRSDAAIRHLRFTSESSTIDLAVESTATGRTVQGWVEPPGIATVRVVGGDGRQIATCDSDEFGHFALDFSETGLVRFELHPYPFVSSEWFQL